jgi:hypothetical protein
MTVIRGDVRPFPGLAAVSAIADLMISGLVTRLDLRLVAAHAAVTVAAASIETLGTTARLMVEEMAM